MLIFQIAQGRTGSTMLWHLFRQIPECTAYVEPFNLQLLNGVKGNTGPPREANHPFITRYWSEYRSIPYQELFEKCPWLSSPKHEIKDFIDMLIGYCKTEHCVIQFNRIWGETLDWFVKTYPEAYIIHLWRDHDPQFKSYKKLGFFGEHFGELQFGDYDLWLHYYDQRVKCGQTNGVRGISNDELFTIVWHLAKRDGQFHADVSINYEDIMRNPEMELTNLLKPLSLDHNVPGLLRYIKPRK